MSVFGVGVLLLGSVVDVVSGGWEIAGHFARVASAFEVSSGNCLVNFLEEFRGEPRSYDLFNAKPPM